jgi:methionyl-tRNA synthetase
VRIASVLLWPVMPGKCEELWRRAGLSEYGAALADAGRGSFEAWARWGGTQPGIRVEKGEALFPRYIGA